MNYLSVGTNHIYREFFQNIENGPNGKPCGGLWATKHQVNSKYSNWIEFLNNQRNYHILFYKNNSDNPFINPAVLITLKDDANIIYIKTQDDLEYLSSKYPDGNDWIDFATLALYCDGIYIDYQSLIVSIKNQFYYEKISHFALSSLLIFNLNCILYYQPALIEIEPFDYECSFEYFNYTIKISDQKEEIKSLNNAAIDLIAKMTEYIKSNNFTNNYECMLKLKKIFNNDLQEVLKTMNDSQNSSIQNLLIRKSIKLFNQF